MTNETDEALVAEINTRFFSGIPTEEMGSNQVEEEKLVAYVLSVVSRARTDQDRITREEVQKQLNKLTVYYRSKFSQDCSRNETEEERNTEMLQLQQVLQSLTPKHNNV